MISANSVKKWMFRKKIKILHRDKVATRVTGCLNQVSDITCN
jgi:hypothetical protein